MSQTPDFSFSFDDLGLEVGDDVLVASDQSLSDFTYCKIIEVKSTAQAIDAIALGQGSRIIRQCWHRDDPRLVTHRKRFLNQGAGIFCLTPGEVERKTLAKRVSDLETRIATLDAAFTQLSVPTDPDAAQCRSAPNQRRGPGRPRTVTE